MASWTVGSYTDVSVHCCIQEVVLTLKVPEKIRVVLVALRFVRLLELVVVDCGRIAALSSNILYSKMASSQQANSVTSAKETY